MSAGNWGGGPKYLALDYFWAHILLKNAIFPQFYSKK